MKRPLIAAVFAAALVASTTLFAAKPVSAVPSIPNNLSTAWVKMIGLSCTKANKEIIVLRVYFKEDSTPMREFFLMTKNGEVVHQLEGVPEAVDERADAYVMNADGTWTVYDWRTEQDAAEAAITRIIGLTPREFVSCAHAR